MEKNINLSNEQDVYWLDVFILEELHEYLRGSDLKELSLVSQLARNKLKSFVFKYILLVDSKLSSDIYYFGLSNDCRDNLFKHEEIQEYENSEQYKHILNKPQYKKLVIDPYLQSMKDEFKIYYPFVQSFKFCNVYQPCYYLINLVGLATNLTSLNIRSSFLLFKEFQIILDGAQYLKSLTLNKVPFVKFKTDKLLNNELSFPKSLQKLTFYHSCLIERHYRKGAYQLIFGGFSIRPISLPIKIENLPNLEYFNYAGESTNLSFLPRFVELNPQIKYLRIPLKEFTKNHTRLIRPGHRVIDTFQLPSNSIDQIIENTYFTGLEFITKFEFNTISNIPDHLLKGFLISCKNLKYLKIPLDINRSDFIQSLIPQVTSLRSLCVDTRSLMQLESEFANTSSVKFLILAIYFTFADEMMLTAPNNFREIFFKFKTDQEGINIGKKIAQRNEGWDFSFRNNCVRWYRKNNINNTK